MTTKMNINNPNENRLLKKYEGVDIDTIKDKVLRKFIQKERDKVEFKIRVKITSHEELINLIHKFRKSPTYRSVGALFYIPTPNSYGSTINGSLTTSRGEMGAYINYNYKSAIIRMKQIGKYFPLTIINRKDNTTEENDKRIKEDFSPKLFGNSVGYKEINIDSIVEKMSANISYQIRINLPKEMSAEEEKEYINSYLQKEDIKELIYGSTKNITNFQFGKVDEKWEEVV